MRSAVLLCVTEWSGTLFICVTVWSPVVPSYLVVCCYVYPDLVLNSMKELGVEEMLNGIDKPSAKRNLIKI